LEHADPIELHELRRCSSRTEGTTRAGRQGSPKECDTGAWRPLVGLAAFIAGNDCREHFVSTHAPRFRYGEYRRHDGRYRVVATEAKTVLRLYGLC